MVKIVRIEDEANNIKSFMFNFKFEQMPTPGQFIMAWVPGIDEKVLVNAAKVSLDLVTRFCGGEGRLK